MGWGLAGEVDNGLRVSRISQERLGDEVDAGAAGGRDRGSIPLCLFRRNDGSGTCRCFNSREGGGGAIIFEI